MSGVDLEVVIDMLDTVRSSESVAEWESLNCRRYIDPSEYDHVTWYFEIMVKNSHTTNAYRVWLADESSTKLVAVTVPAATPGTTNNCIRLRSSSFNMGSAGAYRIVIEQTPGAAYLLVASARLIAHQVGATKTCLPFPMIGLIYPYSPLNTDAIDYVIGSTYAQLTPADFDIFYKNESEWDVIGKWRLDAVHCNYWGSLGNFSEVALFNKTTDLQVSGTLMQSPKLNTPQFTYVEFSNSVSNFTGGHQFEVRHRNLSGSDASYLFSCQLYLVISDLKKASVFKRLYRSATHPLGIGDFNEGRVLGGIGSGYPSYFQVTGYRVGANSQNVMLVESGANDTGYAGSKRKDTSISFTESKSLQRSGLIGISQQCRYIFTIDDFPKPPSGTMYAVFTSVYLVSLVPTTNLMFWLLCSMEPDNMILPSSLQAYGAGKELQDRKLSCRLR